MKLFLLLLIAIGVILIYDAREIVNKYFGDEDKNKQASILKVLGFAISIISGFTFCVLF